MKSVIGIQQHKSIGDFMCTVRIQKFGHQKKWGNHPKIQTRWLYRTVMRPKQADGMVKSVGLDQTAPLLSWSILFACACLFENSVSYGIFQDLNIDYSKRQSDEEDNVGYCLSQ